MWLISAPRKRSMPRTGHDLTFHFSFPVLDALMYDIQQEDIQYLVQVIKHVDDLLTIRNYIATAGTIEIDAASNGAKKP